MSIEINGKKYAPECVRLDWPHATGKRISDIHIGADEVRVRCDVDIKDYCVKVTFPVQFSKEDHDRLWSRLDSIRITQDAMNQWWMHYER